MHGQNIHKTHLSSSAELADSWRCNRDGRRRFVTRGLVLLIRLSGWPEKGNSLHVNNNNNIKKLASHLKKNQEIN